MNLKLTRVRDTAATRARMAMIKNLVAKLADGPMLRDEICFFLCMSPSGARKYIRELCDVGMIAAQGERQNAPRTYTLNPDSAHVAAMLDFMCAARESKSKPDAVEKSGRVKLSEPGGNIHVMADDVQYKIRTTHRIPAPDPVLAHFFGRAGNGA